MTILEVPCAVLVNINRIGNDFNIVRVITEEFGENGADERFHPTVTTRQISISWLVIASAHLDTMTTGMSFDLQYWKNSLKPKSSLMSASGRRGGRSHISRCSRSSRTDTLSLSSCLHSSKVCPFLLTLSSISWKASLRQYVSILAFRARYRRRIPERYMAGEDL